MTRPPPRLAQRILRRWLSDPVRDFMLGDMLERHRSYAMRSPIRADLWYWRQTVAALVARFPGPLGVGGDPATDVLRADLGGALRGLVRRPAQSLTAVATLALGIGVVATAFSILEGTVLRGLPFEEADRLVHFERANVDAGQPSMAVTPHDYLAWRAAQASFVDLGAYVEASAILPVEGAPPERYLGVRISAASFDLLRVAPALGRAFGPADERVGSADVVVLSHTLWASRFGSDPGVVGREIPLNGVPTTVIGVMPEGFGFPIAERFWLPLRIDLASLDRGQGRLDVFGRLRDGVSFAAAAAEFDRLGAGLAASYPDSNEGVGPVLSTFHDEYIGEEFTRTTLRMLLGAILVLLVCCANVTNLLLVRGARRRRDLALRVSLGATRWRIVRQLMTEAALLSALGAVLGTALAWYGVEWFDRAGAQAGVFDLPHGSDSLFWWDVTLAPSTLGVVVAVTAATALLAGAVPALWASRAASDGALTVRTSSSSGGGATGGLARSLVVAQLALTTGLLVIAGLVTRSGLNVAAADDVIETAEVLATRVDLPFDGGRYDTDAARLQLSETLLEGLESAPGIATAAITTALPLTTPHSVPFELEGDAPEAADRPDVGVVTASPGYFDAFRIVATQGRLFGRADGETGAPVALVNESFVRRYVGQGSAVGLRLRLVGAEASEPWVTVVGVVPDLWDRPLEPEREAGIYVPLAQSGQGDATARLGRLGLRVQTVVTRDRPGASDTPAAVRAAVFAADATLPVRELRTMDDVVRQQMGRYRVWGRFYLAFAVAGLLLASLGVYGVLTFSVAQRTSEIGVRRALGASAGSVRRAVMGTAGRQVALGAGLGLLLGAALSDGVGRILYGVDTRDPAVFAVVAVAIVTVALVASWLPASRAAAVDPLEAIRQE